MKDSRARSSAPSTRTSRWRLEPLNDACKALLEQDNYSEFKKWYKELKPRFEDAAVANAILRQAADILGEPIFNIDFDFRYFFMQM
eukprot:804262-Prymnesium_polylepis.1